MNKLVDMLTNRYLLAVMAALFVFGIVRGMGFLR